MDYRGTPRPKKSLGQNFLRDPHYLQLIVDAYGSFALGKLYSSKIPAAADMLYDLMIAFFLCIKPKGSRLTTF